MPPSPLAGSPGLPPSDAVLLRAEPAQLELRQLDSRKSLQAADDSLLIARIAQQDRQAFDVLYRRYSTRLFHFVRRKVHCEALVDEIVNDSMLVLWQSARSFEGASTVLTWLFGIAHRQALRALHRSRKHSIIESNDEFVADTADGHPGMNPESVAITQSDGMLVARGIELLSDHQRILVELTATGHSSIEIAAMTGSLENTVRTRIFHARRHLERFVGTTGEVGRTEIAARGTAEIEDVRVARSRVRPEMASAELHEARGKQESHSPFSDWLRSFGEVTVVLE